MLQHVTAAKATADTYVPQSFTLTISADTLTGNLGNDTFIGEISSLSTANTLNITDKLDGGAGNDTLKATINTNFTGFTTGFVKNIETVELKNGSTIARTFDTSGVTDVTTYKIDANDAGVNHTI